MKQWSSSQPGVFPGEEQALRLQDVPQTARIVDVTAKGARFELASQRGVLYGPARWNLAGNATPAAAIVAGNYPHVGDAALVMFAGLGIENPWIVGWWR